MSDAEPITERDANLWEAIGGDPDDLQDEPTTEVPRHLLEDLLEHVQDLEARVTSLEQGTTLDQDQPPFYYYTNIPHDDRSDHLSTSEQIAVRIHEQWDEIAWTLGDKDNRRVGVDSKTKANAKYNPSKLKHELEKRLERELQSNQIYRALRRLALLSGGKEEVDDYDRVHVRGGEYEYHHRPTPDGQELKHVLYEVS